MNMRHKPDMPDETAQLRAQLGIQAMAIEALTKRLGLVETDLLDMRRAVCAFIGAADLVSDHAPMRRVTMAEIGASVHAISGVTPEDLRGPRRDRPFVYARAIFCAMARRAGYSLTQIGKWLGGRDHTTVMTASRNEQKALDYFAAIRAASDEVPE